jgi:Na+-transporting NADH:ubiquinone oxidoreductase subunit F
LKRECLAARADPTQIQYYLCGPLPMIRVVTKMLTDFNMPPEQIVSDEF